MLGFCGGPGRISSSWMDEISDCNCKLLSNDMQGYAMSNDALNDVRIHNLILDSSPRGRGS